MQPGRTFFEMEGCGLGFGCFKEVVSLEGCIFYFFLSTFCVPKKWSKKGSHFKAHAG